jgi:hypothetical protein
MGTSSSFNGPGDTSHLLPSWALEQPSPLPLLPPIDPPDLGVPTVADVPVSVPAVPAAPSGVVVPTSPIPLATPNPPVAPTPPRSPSAPWKAAKVRMGKVASGGGQPRAIGRAARAYVRAKGGARQAARTARASRSATVTFGGFLADAARRGFAEAMRGLGITQVLNRDAETVFAAIVDAIAPDGARPEEAAARQGIVEALWHLYDQLSVQDGGWARLEAMDGTAVNAALETAVVECVYSRWIQEVGIAFERKAATAQEAVRRQRDVKDYIRESVRLDFQGKNVLEVNWQGDEGRTFVESKYIEAYAIFEEL